jgi:DNA-binding MarR family transcriptional regulator
LISILRPDKLSLPLASQQWVELTELIARCERLLRDDLAERTSPQGISESQFSVLWACHQAPPGGLSQNELAQALALSAAHISGQVEQLRAKGLMAGHRRAPDRRRQVWQLTDQGHRQLEMLFEQLIGWFEQLETQLSPTRRADLAELLRLVAASLEANPSSPESKVAQPTDNADLPQRQGVSA